MKTVLIVVIVLVLAFSGWACALTGSSPPPAGHPGTGIYQDCDSCHEAGVNGAPKTDHPRKQDCVSCHAVQQTTGATAGGT